MLHITDRPTSFEEVVGHESVIASIRKRLESHDRPHVYLLTGPSGVGKTTIARIMAKHMGATGFGIIEKNISNETGVDSARSLIDEAAVVPFEGSAKVYILDEVDKASDSWQSAMKKPLEETPRMTYYIMCTEFPAKVKKALITRAVVYSLNPLGDLDMLYLLKRMCRQHRFDVSREIQEAITAAADGSPRRAIVLLEQIIGMESEEEQMALVTTDGAEPQVRDLCQQLLGKAPWKEVAATLKGIKTDPEGVRRAVLAYMNAVLLGSGKYVGSNSNGREQRAFEIIEVFEDDLYASGKAGLTRMCFEACE